MDKLIELREVTAGYGNKIALRNVTLDVWKNDFLGIIGPNGGGKTTLLKVILGLLPPISGTIRFYDENVEVPSLKIGYLPQMSQIDKKFPISVREVISSGLSAEKPLFRPFNRSQRERVDEVIVQMGLEELAGRAIGELSGGQLQRVLLGRSIVSRPQVSWMSLIRMWINDSSLVFISSWKISIKRALSSWFPMISVRF